MKKLVFLFSAALVFAACTKKETSGLEESQLLEVEKKNMGVQGLLTATWCGPCGGALDNSHMNMLNGLEAGMAVPLVFKDAFSGASGAHGDMGNALYSYYYSLLEASGVPTNFQNFNDNSVGEHLQAPVILNGNYIIDFNGNDMLIRTTTEFFDDFTGDIHVVPFIVVSNLVGSQVGHSDSPETVHHYYVADVAYPSSMEPEDKTHLGYRLSAGDMRAGQRINMEFVATKKPHWSNNNIEIGLVYFRKVGTEYRFMNAFMRH